MAHKKLFSAFVAGLLLTVMLFPASAAETYDSYVYNYWGEPTSAPAAYLPTETVLTDASGKVSLSEPQDLFVAPEGICVIADTGHDRILLLDADWNVVRTVSTLTGGSKILTLNKPAGVFMKEDGTLLIADTENKRVIAVDENDAVVHEYTRPKSDVAFVGIDFLPTKVLADSRGFLYVLCKGLYQGAVTYQEDGTFLAYFGANRVEVTLNVLAQSFWKKIMSQEQQKKMEQIVPEEFTNFDIDERGFIYTCTRNSDNQVKQIKKINPSGDNVMKSGDQIVAAYADHFGDLETKYYQGELIQSQFVDVACAENGFVNGLDFTKGRVFQYTKDGRLVCEFGGIAMQSGTFTNAVAIDTFGEDLLVLDAYKGSVTRFSPTPYIRTLRKAILLLNEGEYDEATREFEQALILNNNSELALSGLGMSLYNQGHYNEALHAFRRANDKSGYAKALKYSRNEAVNRLIPVLLSVLVVAAIAAALISLVRSRKKQPVTVSEYGKSPKRIVRYTLFHPGKGFTDTQERKTARWGVPFLTVLLWFLVSVAQRQWTGFHFNNAQPEKLNVLFVLIQTLGAFCLWTISNWAISTLVDGKACLKEIAYFSSVALIPQVIGITVNLALSNVLLPTESMFLTIVSGICTVWSVLLLAGGLMVFHDFSLGKVVWSALLTVGLMAVVVFFCVLAVSLLQQVVNFADAMIRELFYRL